jgi:uncharacterized protein YggE
MDNSCQHKPIPLILGGFIGLIAIFSIWTWLNSPLIVTVTGQGEMTMNVLNTTLTFSILGDGSDANGAIGSVKAKATNLRKILQDIGISESDIYESQISVVPSSTIVVGAQGFRSSMSMGAKNIPVNKVYSLISTLYANGASVVNQPEIASDNQQQLSKIAFDAAIKDAENQAADIAKTNHKWFRKAISITQSSQPTSSVTNKSDTSEASKDGSGKIISLVSVSYKMW